MIATGLSEHTLQSGKEAENGEDCEEGCRDP